MKEEIEEVFLFLLEILHNCHQLKTLSISDHDT